MKITQLAWTVYFLSCCEKAHEQTALLSPSFVSQRHAVANNVYTKP